MHTAFSYVNRIDEILSGRSELPPQAQADALNDCSELILARMDPDTAQMLVHLSREPVQLRAEEEEPLQSEKKEAPANTDRRGSPTNMI